MIGIFKKLAICFALLALVNQSFAAKIDENRDKMELTKLILKKMRADEWWFATIKRGVAEESEKAAKEDPSKATPELDAMLLAELKKRMPKVLAKVTKAEAQNFSTEELMNLAIYFKTKYNQDSMAALIAGKPTPNLEAYPDDLGIVQNLDKEKYVGRWFLEIRDNQFVLDETASAFQAATAKYLAKHTK